MGFAVYFLRKRCYSLLSACELPRQQFPVLSFFFGEVWEQSGTARLMTRQFVFFNVCDNNPLLNEPEYEYMQRRLQAVTGWI